MAVSGLVELQCQMEKAMNTSKEYILLLHFMPLKINQVDGEENLDGMFT